jgi:hypothetical protein
MDVCDRVYNDAAPNAPALAAGCDLILTRHRFHLPDRGGLDNVKAFFLDIDGTLVDSNAFHVRAWQQAFGENGCPIEYETIRKQIGKGADMLIPAF